MRSLNVWMNGDLVGEWTTTSTGTPMFRYVESWVASPRARALSLSLPITADRELRGEVVENYFDNLLPDSADIRRRIRDRYALRSVRIFELLEAIGRDCVGAVHLLPPGNEPDGWNRIDAVPLDDAAVERHLRKLVAAGRAGDDEGVDDFRISIAGAQEKTALLQIEGAWYRPRGATPTTHILKLPLGRIGNFGGDFSQSVENEWLCSCFLRALGLPVAATTMTTFGAQRVLVVERFDRRWQGAEQRGKDSRDPKPSPETWIARLPQEDFCQATGRSPSRKYENEGGASANEILDVLANSQEAAIDRRNFVLAQIAFWLLAATDGHAKNFSIAQGPANAFRMTPLYDVLSAWPIIGTSAGQLPLQDVKLAMAVAGKRRPYKLQEIQARHWRELAQRVGGADLWIAARQLVAGADAAMQTARAKVPAGFPDELSARIAAGVQRQVQSFAQGLASLGSDIGD